MCHPRRADPLRSLAIAPSATTVSRVDSAAETVRRLSDKWQRWQRLWAGSPSIGLLYPRRNSQPIPTYTFSSASFLAIVGLTMRPGRNSEGSLRFDVLVFCVLS
jgi:hypothetical protein